MQWYYNFLARRPYLMVLAIAVLSIACIIVSFTTNAIPDFSDPTLGFESRGTEIGKRLMAWHNLIRETGPSGSLAANPNDIQYYQERFDDAQDALARKRKNRRNRKRKNRRKQKNFLNETENKKINTAKNHFHKKHYKNSSNSYKQNAYEHKTVNDSNDRSPLQWNGDNGIFRDYENTNDSWLSSIEQQHPQHRRHHHHHNHSEHFEYGHNTTSIDEDYHREKIQTKKSTWRILKQAEVPPSHAGDAGGGIHIPIDGYFCDSPAKQYSHFVIERIGPNATDTLFDLNALFAMCELQNQIAAVPNYEEYCQKEMITDNCCRAWSLPNYATLFANKSSCFELTTDDVTALQNLLVSCYEYYHDLKLSNDCNEYNRCYAPAECKHNNIVFNILHFLADYNFIKINDSTIYLKYAMIFIPVAHSTKILPLFHEWSKANLKNELVQVTAMDLGLENELFNELLLTDGWLVALGGIFVMTCIWLYTTSIFVTIMTCIAVLFSLGLAYFIYTLVFEMSFFPYMNLLAVVVIIGIGADNAFLFVKIWQCVLAERFSKTSTVTTQSTLSAVEPEHTETLQNLMALTFRHAALSMFVSSLTTAGAFFASYTSSITAIKCFGVFAGTVAITNYILMITWLPASVSIMERISACTTCSKLQVQKLLLMINKSINKFCNSFEAAVIAAVMNYAVLWLIIFSAIGVCSAVIVLYSPGLQLPDNAHFQLFVSDHPFEVYNAKLKNEFWFEKSMAIYENFKLPLRFVWGIQPIDDGDYTNPYSHGNLYYDNNFNISAKAAQKWLVDFCTKLKEQPFYQLTFGSLLPNCFIENFISIMNRMCIDSMDGTDRTPCCDISKFPYEPHIFELCLPQITSSLYSTPREFYMPGVAGPKFHTPPTTLNSATLTFTERLIENNSNENGSNENITFTHINPPLVKALVIEFESNMSFTTAYHDVKRFVATIEKWFTEQLYEAPAEMQHGWFTSELKFFDVQDTLSHGTILAISVAMSTSLIVLMAVTLNVLLSCYAVITVTFSIFTTVATLILLGWKLNVLESITVSTAIGLAIDFSLHYSVHYRLSPTCERVAATQFALSRIIGPTAMAAITTGMAGALMMASNVLPYIQIGIFLVFVMTVSWTYGTFFLMSLLKVAGPQYGFMQFNYPRISKRPAANGIKYYERKPSQVVASEQLLTPSSSAVGELINSETHELESLTSNSLIKTISGTECSTHALPMDFEHSFNNKLTNNRAGSIKDQRSCALAANYKSPSTESATIELPSSEADVNIFYK